MDGDTQSLARRARKPALLRYVREGAIAVVMKNKVRNSVELVGMAVSAIAGLVLAAKNVGAEVPFQVAGNDQIEAAVAIIVDKTRARAPTAAAHAGLCSNVGKGAVAVIVIKNVSTQVGH